MKIINLATGKTIAGEVMQAHSFWHRFQGLMFKREMPEGTALHLYPCSSIHTFFMKFDIDVIYINNLNEIVGIERNLASGKIGRRFKKAASVIELGGGTLEEGLSNGDTIAFVDKNETM